MLISKDLNVAYDKILFLSLNFAHTSEKLILVIKKENFYDGKRKESQMKISIIFV